MILEEVINKNFIQFKEKKVNLPYKIYEAIIRNDFVIIKINGDLPKDIDKKLNTENKIRLCDADLVVVNNYLSILSQNIMCFDLDGNLKWKIPKIYSKEADQREIDRVGHPLFTNYVYMEIESENVLMARTSYGNKIRVNIADGTLISRTDGTPF